MKCAELALNSDTVSRTERSVLKVREHWPAPAVALTATPPVMSCFGQRRPREAVFRRAGLT